MKYENIIFMQGSDADEFFKIQDELGNAEAMKLLKQWHFPKEHEVKIDDGPWGSSDRKYQEGKYIMSYNKPLHYVGLIYVLDEKQHERSNPFNISENKILNDLVKMLIKVNVEIKRIEAINDPKKNQYKQELLMLNKGEANGLLSAIGAIEGQNIERFYYNLVYYKLHDHGDRVKKMIEDFNNGHLNKTQTIMKLFSWQGGTVHQVNQELRKMTKNKNFDLLDIPDEKFGEFVNKFFDE